LLSLERPVYVTYPSDVNQYLGKMAIQCDFLGGVNGGIVAEDLNDCAHRCNKDASCHAFTYYRQYKFCYMAKTFLDLAGRRTEMVRILVSSGRARSEIGKDKSLKITGVELYHGPAF
jgi:hypothetical protein